MTSGIPTPVISADSTDHRTLSAAIAAEIAHLPHRPRLLGFGEPMHSEDEFPRLRNAVFAALVEQAGFTSIALETSAWHGRIVDAYIRGGDGVEDDIMAAGFTHGFGEFPANRMLIRWMREQNRLRPKAAHLRFAGFDAPTEMTEAPSPRAALRVLHDFLRTRAGSEIDLPPWDTIDLLLGPDEPWIEPAAAMEPARSIGTDSRVPALRVITDDLRWTLAGEIPRLRRETGPDDIEDALLAGRTAAGLLAYHKAMARDTDHRWQRLAAIRDTMMAENLQSIADRGPTLVSAHNEHLRAGTSSMSFGPITLRWQTAGAHLADRLGDDYRVIACALGEATHHDIPEPASDTIEGALHHGLPPGNHLLSAPELQALQQRRTTRSTPNFRYIPIDDTFLGQVDQVLFLRSITPAGRAPRAAVEESPSPRR
ncbi:erythromycin esterase family protein [Pseudonocardia sp. CA-142604]|uniref:erythromycin esterase family protein n=1 Tax=Pseudonocardia sp. CA-142604 TaxID=3240024 RepID=UPI003D8B78FD